MNPPWGMKAPALRLSCSVQRRSGEARLPRDGLPIFLSIRRPYPRLFRILSRGPASEIPDMFGTCAGHDFLLIFAAAMRCQRRHVPSYYETFSERNLLPPMADEKEEKIRATAKTPFLTVVRSLPTDVTIIIFFLQFCFFKQSITRETT